MKISVDKIQYEAMRGEILALRGSANARREREEKAIREATVASETVKALRHHKEENEELKDIIDRCATRINRLWFAVGFEAIAVAGAVGALIMSLMGGS
jgi:hypothetical protein